ncbi:hypothetical protein ARMSODRAFT_1078004 [Armillaria solidipes]|uniref:Uncharacterized protein n=1 Tax=Armillaria solidipes TaxID=1076256 RepID=A0A2H3C999_9AGAR|nr:hypothetical protein ARMSODRAFT_1078004 [Armillaria solidipes]
MDVEEKTIGANAEVEVLPMDTEDDFDSGLWEISTLEPDIKDEVKQFSSAFQQTIEHYEDVEGEGPWKVPQRIRQSVFEAWSDRRTGRYPISYDLATGYVHIYGDPSRVHQFMAGRLMTIILSSLRRKFVDVMAKYFGDINDVVDIFESVISTGASPLHSIIHPGAGHHKMMKEPDGSITISHTLSLHRPTQNTAQVPEAETSSVFASDSASLPGIIIEVAYRNESLPALLEEVEVWSRSATKHKADLVVAIAIRPNIHDLSDPFAVLVASRDDGPPIAVPFGSGSPVVLASTFKHPGAYDVSPFTADVLPGFLDSHCFTRSQISELSPVLPLGQIFKHLDFERIERAFNVDISSDDRRSLIEFSDRLDLGPLRFALLSLVYH